MPVEDTEDIGYFSLVETDFQGYSIYTFVTDRHHDHLSDKVDSRAECKDDICHLYHLEVKKDSRQAGIGSSVLKAAEELARDLCISKIDVSIGWKVEDEEYHRSKSILRRFLEKNGYVPGHFSRKQPIERCGYTIIEYKKEIA